MEGLSTAQLVDLWEQGVALPWHERALVCLGAARPNLTSAELAELSIGARDRELFALRERLSGRWLKCFVECPACNTPMGFSLDGRQFCALPTTSKLDTMLDADLDDFRIRVRLLTSIDLREAAAAANAAMMRRELIARCVIEITHDGSPTDSTQLSASQIERLGDFLADADGRADSTLGLTCVACNHVWQETFDIVSFLWTEISALTRRYLEEVHVLAWAYGWREKDILAMSPARRSYYLARVQ